MPMRIDPQIAALIRTLQGRLAAMDQQQQALIKSHNDIVEALQNQPRPITQEIDSIPGRRIFYSLVFVQDFDASFAGTRAAAMSAGQISADGAFIQTHYPLAIWQVNSPSTATNIGAWRPVSTWPLPDQVLDTDLIDISYEVFDTGPGRNFQNAPVPPLLSRPDNLMPLPVPTLWAVSTNPQIYPTYNRISFNTTGTASDGGQLVFVLPGYKIVNQ